MSDHVMENENLTAVFDGTTGALKQLTSRLTGWNVIRRPDLAMSFRLQVPVPGHLNNMVEGTEQRAASIVPGKDGRSLTITWSNLTSRFAASLDITVKAEIRLDAAGLSFTPTIENRSAHTVQVVAFPCISDLTPSAPDKSISRIQPKWMTLDSRSLYPGFTNTGGYWGTYHPIEHRGSNIDALFVLLAEPGQGFYIGCHAPALPHLTIWYSEQIPGPLDSYSNAPLKGDTTGSFTNQLRMMVLQFGYVAPGETRTLSPIVIKAYTGDWMKGFDVYKAWRSTWHRTPRRPAWCEDIHSWLQIQIYNAGDEKIFSYSDLPGIARDCKKHGIDAIQLTGWADGGQDRGNPSHSTDPALGTPEELAAAIEECHAMGVKIILFTKWTWWDNTRPDYATEGIRHVAKDPYGNVYPHQGYQYYTWPQLAGIDNWRLVVTCTASPEWRKRAVAEFRKVLSTGAAGMLFDECQHHFQTAYCFDPSHKHEQPAFLYRYDNQLARDMKDVSDPLRPDFLYSGELCYDAEMQEYHLLYTRFGRGHTPATRYIDPYVPMMMAVTGFDDRNQINKCLEYRYIMSYEPLNFKGRPSDAPLTMEYGRRVNDLRRRYRRYLWDGEFRFNQDATLQLDGKPSSEFSVYVDRITGKRAVVVCNLDMERSVPATVDLAATPGTAWVVASPDAPDAVPVTGPVILPPRSAAVFMQA